MAGFELFSSTVFDGSTPEISGDQYCQTTGMCFLMNVSAVDEGQSVTMRVTGDDAFGNTYNHGPAFPVVSATGQYEFVMHPGMTTTGGSIPADGIVVLPMLKNFNVRLDFGDTSGDLDITLSLCAIPLV